VHSIRLIPLERYFEAARRAVAPPALVNRKAAFMEMLHENFRTTSGARRRRHQRERFELSKAREQRLAAKSQNRETNVANKADSEIRFAKNAVSSPSRSAGGADFSLRGTLVPPARNSSAEL